METKQPITIRRGGFQRKPPSEDFITHGCNLLRICEKYGVTFAPTDDIRAYAKDVVEGNAYLHPFIKEGVEKHDHIMEVFLKHLERTMQPLLCGVARKWRKTQEEHQLASIKSLSRGYVRLLSEVPTGGGKSMMIGAFIRAALDTIRECNLDQEIHIFTSRVSIAGQLIDEKLPDDERDDRPLEIGKKGDVRIWCPELSDDKIRVIAGFRGSRPSELQKDAIITVSTYQGLRAGRIEKVFRKKAFLIICDESHHLTDRIGLLLDQMKSMVIGMSATVLGPDRDPFFFFEKIERPELEQQSSSFINFLNYHKSIAEMIQQQELKPVRWLNVKDIKIDISDVALSSGKTKKGSYDVFNEASVARALSKYPTLGAQVVAETYLSQHAGLELSGSRPIHERRGIVFVDRVEFARLCADTCNEMIPQKLKELHGPDAYFKAAYVDGTMTEAVYNARIKSFERGEYTLLFSAEKIGEGVDLPFVNLIFLLRVLGLGSLWKLKQNLGRGLRIDPNSPLDDLVVIDSVFTSSRHLLASVLGIFGQAPALSGGLIAGWGSAYELENKVFKLLLANKTWKEVWDELSFDERKQFPFVEQKMLEEKNRYSLDGSRTHSPIIRSGLSVEAVQLVEDENIRFALSLGNQQELVRYTKEQLQKEGYGSLDRLRSVSQNSLGIFAKKQFGKFRDGLTMVNINTNKNEQRLTASLLYDFIAVMRAGGLPEKNELVLPPPSRRAELNPSPFQREVVPSSKKAFSDGGSRKLRVDKHTKVSEKKDLSFTRDTYGVEAEMSTTIKDLFGKEPQYVCQAVIVFPEGHVIATEPGVGEDTKELASATQKMLELKVGLARERGQITVFYNSQMFVNYKKIVALVALARNFDSPTFTVTEREGVYTVVASISKFGGISFSGRPAVHTKQSVAKEFALAFLGIKLTQGLTSFTYSALTIPRRRWISDLFGLCKKYQLGVVQQRFEQIKTSEGTISKAYLYVYGLSAEGFGITEDHAKEDAAEKLYHDLLQVQGGSQLQ